VFAQLLILNLIFLYATLDIMSIMGIVGVEAINNNNNKQIIRHKTINLKTQPIIIPKTNPNNLDDMKNPYIKHM
jgi:hypothetical protein